VWILKQIINQKNIAQVNVIQEPKEKDGKVIIVKIIKSA
jgi:hypothetical protein